MCDNGQSALLGRMHKALCAATNSQLDAARPTWDAVSSIVLQPPHPASSICQGIANIAYKHGQKGNDMVVVSDKDKTVPWVS